MKKRITSGKRSLSFVLCLLMVCQVIATMAVVTPLTANAAQNTAEDISLNRAGGGEFVEVNSISQGYRVNGDVGMWRDLNPGVSVNSMCSVRLLTSADKPYHLVYRTKNVGKDWLGYVDSTKRGSSDFAGWNGYAISNLEIQVQNKTGASFNDDYVVMYRSKVADEWLDWVSNGKKEVMETIKAEFGLQGNLDAVATNSGWASRGNIQALEIRCFERVRDPQEIIPSENAKIINAPYINQMEKYINGCESVSTVMALQYLGVDISIDTFINNYLIRGQSPNISAGTGGDPDLVYPGNPADSTGWGCNSPVIMKTLDKFIDKSKIEYNQYYNKSLESLCKDYIDKDIPVVIWATVGMIDSSSSEYYSSWTSPEGKRIDYNRKLHALLMVGYDEENYYFNDPMNVSTNGYKCTGYPKEKVQKAYEILNQQCIVINKKASIEPGALGDVTGDAKIDTADAIAVLKYEAELMDLTENQLKSADVTKDGIVDIADAIKITRYDAGLLNEFK